MDFLIREITRPELDRKAEVVRRSFGSVAEQLGLSAEDSQARQAILDGRKTGEETEPGDLNFGAYATIDGKEQMIGSAQILRTGDGSYELRKLAVLPSYRHNGVGRALMEYGCGLVRGLGGEKLKITIIESDVVLKNWYMKLGFIHIGAKKLTHLPYTIGLMERTL